LTTKNPVIPGRKAAIAINLKFFFQFIFKGFNALGIGYKPSGMKIVKGKICSPRK